MQDQHTELTYHPRELLSCQGVERVLCVAPHPDDEVFGCGGLLAALADDGCNVHTVIVTSGEAGADPAALPNQVLAQDLRVQRQAESRLAAQELGTHPPEFLGLEDRQLRYGPILVEALARAIRQHEPQILLLPSLSEPHPDHQATALAGLAAARGASPALLSVLFYECGAPLHANVHFPIDSVSQRKWRAVQRFASQLGMEDYEGHARAMATLRAFGLRPACREAESFFRVDMAAVREKGALAALPQWPWVRQRLELANDPAQLPLVSVLVRSMNRACLPEALASVALQTHANLELVLVNASGQPHVPLDYLPATLPWRIVEPPETPTGASGPAGPSGATRACGRARAANLALQAARGELALFLDDDDLLNPPHLERLIAALQAHPQAVGAYAGVRVETHDGTHVRDYDLPWSRERLQGVNFLPIHAVLFRMNCVRESGLRFDENLPVLEDWDFWLQLTEGADLVHCPGVSAVYRQGLGQSALGDPTHPNHWRVWHRRLLERRTADTPRDVLAATLAWHAVELDRAQAQAARLAVSHQADLARLEQAGAQALRQTQALESALTQAQALAQQHQAARDALQQRLELFSLETQAALSAKESALQAAQSEAALRLAEREAQAQEFAALSQRELDTAQAQLQLRAAEHARLLQAKEAELQRVAAENALLLQSKEAELQRFSMEAQHALDAKEAELQRVAAEHVLLLQSKEAELQRFSTEVRHALDAKEAELQRVATDARQALQEQAAEQQAQQELMQQAHAAAQEALSREITSLLQRLAKRETDLRAVLSSRSWRWTAMLRRGSEPLAEPGP